MRVSFSLPSAGSSVHEDWRAWLPSEKEGFFSASVKQLEVNYSMFSIALNEAIELHQNGQLIKASQAIHVIPKLCLRLVTPLSALLRALNCHSRHYGTIPNTASLDPKNFRGLREQRAAKMNDLLSQILLTRRSQFLHKITTLGEIVEDAGATFCRVAADLGDGESAEPAKDWQIVEAAHYDLNTCLREAVVLLKSFLLVLPKNQLGAFEHSVREQTKVTPRSVAPAPRLIRHRRMAPIAGE